MVLNTVLEVLFQYRDQTVHPALLVEELLIMVNQMLPRLRLPSTSCLSNVHPLVGRVASQHGPPAGL